MRRLWFAYKEPLSTNLAVDVRSMASPWPNKFLDRQLRDKFDEIYGGITPIAIQQVYRQVDLDLLPYRLAVKG